MGWAAPATGTAFVGHAAGLRANFRSPVKLGSSDGTCIPASKARAPAWSMNGGRASRRGAFQLMLGACAASLAFQPVAKETFAAEEQKGKSMAEEAKSGGIAGVAVSLTKQTILYPIDTVKVRLQSAPLDASRPIWTRGDLIQGLYKGFLVPVVFSTPAAGIFFAAKYEIPLVVLAMMR